MVSVVFTLYTVLYPVPILDSQTDKLMNYIRYWQASGESIKTSIRVKTKLGQMVQAGEFTGGTPPYGYRLEKQGRVNKKKRELCELLVDENEAEVVRLIFQKYVYEGYGAQRLSRYLYEQGYRNRKGTNFANTTIVTMLKNPTYTGILRSGEQQSDIMICRQQKASAFWRVLFCVPQSVDVCGIGRFTTKAEG